LKNPIVNRKEYLTKLEIKSGLSIKLMSWFI
jgi:hypothetical protein